MSGSKIEAQSHFFYQTHQQTFEVYSNKVVNYLAGNSGLTKVSVSIID